MTAHDTRRVRRSAVRILRLLLATFVVHAAACRPSGSSPGVEIDAADARRAIEQRVADWARWTADGQIDSLADVFAADAWEADPNLPPIVGREAIVEHWHQAMATGRWHFEPHIEDVIIRDSIAIKRSSYKLRYLAQPGAGGPPSLEDLGSWVNVWRRDDDGQWRLLWTIAASKVPSQGGR